MQIRGNMKLKGAQMQVKGNGNVITDERALSPFEKIEVSGCAGVRFHASPDYRAVVAADSNCIEYLETLITNNVLEIRQKSGVNCAFTKNMVDVYCPALSEISISGLAEFETSDKIAVPAFGINISGSGKINGTIECNTLSVHTSGLGNIALSGNSKDADIDISGAGNFDGREFRIGKCSVHISGTGKVSLFVEDRVDAHVSGLGKVEYRGNAAVNFSNSGLGKIKKLD